MIKGKNIALSAVIVGLLSLPAAAQDAPFGAPDEVDYANQLWQQMAAARLVGPNEIQTTTYEGGTFLQISPPGRPPGWYRSGPTPPR